MATFYITKMKDKCNVNQYAKCSINTKITIVASIIYK